MQAKLFEAQDLGILHVWFTLNLFHIASFHQQDSQFVSVLERHHNRLIGEQRSLGPHECDVYDEALGSGVCGENTLSHEMPPLTDRLGLTTVNGRQRALREGHALVNALAMDKVLSDQIKVSGVELRDSDDETAMGEY